MEWAINDRLSAAQCRHSSVYWGLSLRTAFEKWELSSFPSSCWFKVLNWVLTVWVHQWQVHIVHVGTALVDPFLGCAQGIDAAAHC